MLFSIIYADPRAKAPILLFGDLYDVVLLHIADLLDSFLCLSPCDNDFALPLDLQNYGWPYLSHVPLT